MLPQLRKTAFRPSLFGRFTLVFLLLSVVPCAFGQDHISIQGHVRHGRKGDNSVYGGDQPVVGAHIYLFAVNESGNGLNPISMMIGGTGGTVDSSGNEYVTSGTGGAFSITGFSASNCPTPTSPMYLLALGGNPGIGSNNPAIALMSALSVTCSNLASASSLAVNELTTVAATFSLSAFANTATNSLSTTTINLANLQLGFQAANNMVNSLTGAIYTVVPGTSVPVPVATINTMADILAACVNTNGDSLACNTLFDAAAPPGAVYPANTLQAAFDIAANVNQNVTTIYNLLPSPTNAAFTPTLTASPANWTIAATAQTTVSIQPEATQIYANGATFVNGHVSCNTACGTVEFRYDGVDRYSPAVIDSNGNVQAYVAGWLGYGPHVIQAFYGGSSSYAASDSATTTIQVLFGATETPTTTTITPSTAAFPNGQATLDVQVSCTTSCTGYVTLYQDGYWLGTNSLDANGHDHIQGNESYGFHTFYVVYSGDANYLPSTSPTASFTNSSTTPTTVYSYNISSYQPNGNVQAFSDSTNGNWSSITYDNLNRMTSATQTIPGQAAQYFCWSYDSFGNRRTQLAATSQCNGSTPPSTVNYNSQNQVTFLQNIAPNGFTYDAAGNVTADGTNQYLYDAEGRVCAVGNTPMGGGMFMTQYIYDAEGQRVAKGTITSWSCNTNSNGFVQTNSYVLGSSGEQVSELDGNGSWIHTNVFAAGQLIATYRNDAPAGQAELTGLHYHLADWLGTNRVQLTYAGQSEETCRSLAFGDGLNCTGVADSTEQHFTGKERDTESGLDHFQFRSYSSNMGRWMSPDPAGMMAADIEYPQTLNRYAYVNNNPLSFTDPLGLDCAYLNNSGSGVESFDQHSSSGECGKTGGYWVDGGLTDAKINADKGTVQLTGTNNGTDQTHASYQDTSVYVGMYQNTWTNPFGHIAMAFPGQTPLGFNPKDDAQFQKQFTMHQRDALVPGAVKPQVGGQLKQTVRIPVTGMQAQMIQNAINQSMGNPGNYTLGDGNGCDCGTWAQQMLGDAGINSGSSARLPSNLMQQLQQQYPQQ
jgi:RHS repeat-associated protein